MHLLGEVKRYSGKFRTFELDLRNETANSDAGNTQRKLKTAVPMWESADEK